MDNSPKRGTSRSSLACLACRSRHIKCDGSRPRCSRCSAQDIQCDYTKSRRGGLSRAALAESKRRKQFEGAQNAPPPLEPHQAAVDAGLNFTSAVDFELRSHRNPRSPPPLSSRDFSAEFHDIDRDSLVESYYHNFHKFHPLVVPWRCLVRLWEDHPRRSSLRPLVAIIRLIGYIYKHKQWSAQIDDVVKGHLAQGLPQDPFNIQAHLLYSVALFWYDDKQGSARHKAAAGQLAIKLGLNRKEFAQECGEGDSTLTESWRRTWWWNYIIEAYYLGTLGTLEFAVVDIEADVDLPCSEEEYESGNIPEPRTLVEYENREFLEHDVSFSSFAHLIGAVKCAASAIKAVPKVLSGEASAQMLQSADSKLDGWLLLMPEALKCVMSKAGKIDELMHQAFLVVHVSSIGLHRPLSDLRFNQVESVSSCAREPPRDIASPDLINVHTLRVMRSIEAQIRIMALPVRPFHHTPFTTCMVSEGTLALLSACKFQLKDKELQIARDQIRMTIGCLKALGEVWPRTARNVGEIQMIARHVLDVGRGVSASKSTPEANQVPDLSSGNDYSGSSEGNQSGGDFMPSFGDVDLCGLDAIAQQMFSNGDSTFGLSWMSQ